MALEEFLCSLSIDASTLRQLSNDLSQTYKELALNSSDQFLATPVNILPSGQETGSVLAIDIGGSNLRVGFVQLLGDSRVGRSFDRSWPIGDHFKVDKPEDLFAWIGDCIAEVVRACFVARTMEGPGPHVLGDVIPLGIAWSFPLMQNSISEATLMQMGKGFAINSKLDLGALLLKGYEKHTHSSPESGVGLPRLQVAAITNDTLATFASLSYTANSTPQRQVVMGLIVGTGVNAAISLPIRALHPSKIEPMTLPIHARSQEDTICINTEWAIRGTSGPLRKHDLITRWDVELDTNCEAPGYMPFEYMTGGRYLGEIVRLIIYDYLISEERCIKGQLPEALTSRNGLNTTFLSSRVAIDIQPEELAVELTQALPTPPNSEWHWTRDRALALQRIARAVQRRAAQMIAAAVVGALSCSGDLVTDHDMQSTDNFELNTVDHPEELIVAYTGGVIAQYPKFLEDCQASIDSLVSSLARPRPKQSVVLEEVQNGGVTGAGVLAGTVWKLPAENHAATASGPP